jgi:cyclic nucleotide gated channel
VVPNLENQDDQNLLERICESLKPKYYNEDIDILRVGEPITMMVFTTQGSVWCFKPSNDENGDSADHQSIDTFELYGEELLRWLNHSPSHKKMLPITATKTVRTHSKVETFALTANDLKHLVPRHTRAAEATKGFVQGVFRHLN